MGYKLVNQNDGNVEKQLGAETFEDAQTEALMALGWSLIGTKDDLMFICPVCGGNKIKSVSKDAVVADVITDLSEDGNFDYDGVDVIEVGEVRNYQCCFCNFAPKDKDGDVVDTDLGLVKFPGE